MGCRICVAGRKNPVVLARRAAHMAMNKKQGVCKQAISRASRWAFFQFITPSADSFSVLGCALKLHAGTDFHRLSMDVLVHGTQSPHSSRLLAPVQPAAPRAGQPAAPRAGQPAAPSNIDSLDAVAGYIHDPFRSKGVPQRQEWIDVWADCTSYISIRKQEVLKEKRGERVNGCFGGLRQRKRAMIRVAAEVVRESCRKRIREATSISLAVDECDTRKVIRVRCDTPEPPYQWDGAICICKKLYGITGDVSRELKDDHAVHNRRLFEQSLQSFYMPLKPHVKRQYVRRLVAGGRFISGGAVPPSGGAVPASGGALPANGRANPLAKRKGTSNVRADCNTDDLSDFVKKVRIVASDGGKSERRAVFMMAQQYFPNVHFVIEDPAHGLRIALTKPLQLESYFKGIQEALWKSEHALIPDIQNSGKWKEVLKGICKATMRIPGLHRQGALKVVLDHLAYAKVRMDSTADPLAKLCLMLMPIAYMLSFIAADERINGAQRARACEVLAKFQPNVALELA